MESTIDDKRKPTSRKTAFRVGSRGERTTKGEDEPFLEALIVHDATMRNWFELGWSHAAEHNISDVFRAVYRMDPVERIGLIEEGVEPALFTALAMSMRRSRESFGRLMGMPRTTVSRKLQKGEAFSTDDSERLIAAAKLIGQVENMVEESGNPEGFDAAQWFNQWLDKPLPALNNRPPADFMSTGEGRELLSRLLATAQSSTYA